MDDRVFIRHPDEPHRNGHVTRTAYDNLWSKKGYVIEGDEQPAAAPPEDEPTESPATPEEPQETEADEASRLKGILAAHGVKVDKRWGLKRLRTETAIYRDAE